MKKNIARKKFYEAKLHERKNLMNVHLSKDLKTKLKTKKRAMLINKGDGVRIARGAHKNKNAKVAKVNYNKLKVFLEGISCKNAKGTEKLIPFHPSKLILIDINMSKDRKKKLNIIEEIKNEETEIKI